MSQLERIILGSICLCLSCTLEAAGLTINIDGIDDEELNKQLLEVAEAKWLTDELPQTESRLRQVARQHLPALQKLMRSEGYYNAKITPVDVKAGDSPHVNYRINPDKRFTFNKVTIQLTDPDNEYQPPDRARLGLHEGKPAKAQNVLDAASKLQESARNAGYPDAEVTNTEAVVDHRLGVMDIVLTVRSGPFGKLALPTFTGLMTVKDSALLEKVPWKAGDSYHPNMEARFKRRLLDTRLFSVVRFEYGEKPDTDGLLPVTVELKERKHRTLKAGLRFHSDEGIGTNLAWQHRNIWGGGELLDLNLDLATEALVFETRLRNPDFYRLDQALLAFLTLEKKTTDAFDSLALDSSIGIERSLAPQKDLSVGIGFRLSDIEQDGKKESYGLLYLPVGFKWDASDNLLDPTRGFRMQLEAAPYTDLLNDNVSFIRLHGKYSHYLQVMDSPRIILAGRLTLASLSGASRDRIPPDIRFYAGGGGSVRGIGFQLASPLDDDKDPLGGRSLFELSLETRMRITESIGIVAFIDAGQAYDTEYPDFQEDPQLGAGLGLRYHTPIGPVRLDVGIPLDKRTGIDDSFQVYISLGQAF